MENILKIPLGDLNKKVNVYIGDKYRESSATSVSFLSDKSLVCCVFIDCTMYSIEFDFEDKTYEIIKKIPTTFNGEVTQTDLMSSLEDGTLAVSNFFDHSASIYKHNKGGEIYHLHDVPYVMGDRVHGVKFYDENTLALTCRNDSGAIVFVDIESGKEVFHINMKGFSVQDICFISDNHFVIISTLGSPKLNPFEMYDSVLHEMKLVDKEIKIIKKTVFQKAHLDNIVKYDSKFYITDQFNNKVLVLDMNTLSLIDEITGYDFPHGLDVKFGLIAVTNYGSNTIDIRKLK